MNHLSDMIHMVMGAVMALIAMTLLVYVTQGADAVNDMVRDASADRGITHMHTEAPEPVCYTRQEVAIQIEDIKQEYGNGVQITVTSETYEITSVRDRTYYDIVAVLKARFPEDGLYYRETVYGPVVKGTVTPEHIIYTLFQ